MIILKVRLIKTLKAGDMIWVEGEVLPKNGEPLHPVILDEIHLETGTVEILEKETRPDQKGFSTLSTLVGKPIYIPTVQEPTEDLSIVNTREEESFKPRVVRRE